MTFYVAARLSDGVTWAQISSMGMTGSPKEPLSFSTREEAEQWIARNYPSWVRPDVFHGLQPLQIAESEHDHSTSNRADHH